MVALGEAAYSVDGLKDRLLDHHRCFETLVGLIAPVHYFPSKELDEDTYQGGRYGHNKKNKAPKQTIKEATKKAKRAKLDPNAPKTVSEIQHEMTLHTQSPLEMTPSTSQPTVIPPTPHPLRPMAAATAIELKDRLQKRIEELRAKRNIFQVNDDSASPSAPKTRQDIIEKRKQKKQQRKEAMLKKRDSRKKMDDTLGMDVQKTAIATNTGTGGLKMDVSFGKIDFGLEEKKKGPTDAVALLQKAEIKKAKMDKLKETNEEKAQAVEESESWNKLIKMAEGTKVKDDVQLLKKTVKRQTQEKKKSSEEWSGRQEQLTKDQKVRQDKRQENIQSRIDAKRDRKFGGKNGSAGKVGKKVAPGKGGKRPGFEGGVRKSKK
ncbi:hypothetical protein BASA50_000097 [Batrachochytrium salamandrivorans]|uniref:Ribosomal RNA-processing protein 14/surfeit locus protein 6 C-terminal domain-containing protein n=1 Tax=Batrachochytrium salamandrivorans TaxID=1357716 RepID=A0ABQ8EV79_9FUNG|nr:hypothetical protein BASA60_000442 [Batrachochytrium salamandrivorans]KAH6578878.1 hypothetical protein BASA61_000409 [Batrachochytrium salamandrivorans]KAH6587049.1 hypothetical protein BASA50_000097 [Batrachochytrium salamandrivorans]KAH9271538.1 hypothetical protein BASA83_006144 [Batrachochytrium salamandrivorans]